MTRLATLIAVLALASCNKPTESNCRLALANMQRLLGTEKLADDAQIESEVRRCKGGSSRKAVDCAIKAQNLDELRHCEFFKIPDKLLPTNVEPPAGSAGSAGVGSAGAQAGSAGSAGAAAGSAGGAADSTAGSASGSAAPATAGSAGSAR